MKILLFFAFLLTLSLNSCKGDFECICTVNGTDHSALSYYDVEKSFAKTSCGNYEYNLQTQDAKCRIEKK